jgi:hypothetical protein
LTSSLGTNLWVNDIHLFPKIGEQVFRYDMTSITNLAALAGVNTGVISSTMQQEIANRLVSLDKLLAQAAINQAAIEGASPSRLKAARHELASGDKTTDRQKYISSIVHYRNAWKIASRWTAKASRN